MNYRHAFHAGNFADVLKHVLLSRILLYLSRKPGPLCFIDTHAGIGRYDLAGAEAERTGEWRDGIGRLDGGMLGPAASLLEPYLESVGPRAVGGRPLSYPGSPALAQQLLRPIDRLVLYELHSADAAQLGRATRGDARVTVLARDGYAGLKATVPPRERRGLVLIDPPFEDRGEFDAMLAALADAYRRWPTGTYALWYPIKSGVPSAVFLRRLHEMALPKVLEIELMRDTAGLVGAGLLGSGLAVVNPPYVLKDEADQLLPALARCFGPGWSWRVDGPA